MDIFSLYKLLHVVSSIVWVGGSVLLIVFGIRVAASRDTDRLIAFTEDTMVAGRVFMITGISTLVWGVLMVLEADAIEFSQAWISIGFLGIAVGAVLGPAFYNPQAKKLLAQLRSGDAAAPATARRIGMVSQLETVILLVVVWAMIYKPGL